MSPPTLNYEPPQAGRVSWNRLPTGGLAIVVATVRHKAGPSFAAALDFWGRAGVLGLLASPVLAPLTVLLHTLLVSKRPRAIIEIGVDEIVIRDRGDVGLGWWCTTLRWPRKDVGGFRRNRFERMLFLRVPGKISHDLLDGLDEPTLEKVCRLVDQAMIETG
jgi:hypothetical protein